MSYNGWSNYETWAVKLWIDNEEGSYNYWRDEAQRAWEKTDEDEPREDRTHEAAYALAKLLKDEHEQAAPELLSGVFSDLLNAALSEVNWDEIAESMITDFVDA